tara:strand:- start:166 stop:501 length:336 start_codon:yes stop_codon:yes gene_type:complete
MKIKDELKEMVLNTIKEIEELPDTYQSEEEEVRNRFFDDILSITYYSWFDDKGKQVYTGCDLLVAFGGPNISIDTKYNLVSGYWGSDKVEFSFDDDNFLYEYFEEIFELSI